MQLTDNEIADLCRRLAKLLDDDQGRGMATWQMARERLGRQLYDALGAALGEPARLWKRGDMHECGLTGTPHAADDACVAFALAHGDRFYAGLRGCPPRLSDGDGNVVAQRMGHVDAGSTVTRYSGS